jgi:hypothetical protein
MRNLTREVDVDPTVRRYLPAATFLDAYCLEIAEPDLDAMTAARRIMDRTPGWVNHLMRLRNLAVSPFGLKTGPQAAAREAIGSVIRFPIIEKSPTAVIVGLNDKHLDFRIVIETHSADGQTTSVRLTSLVAPHNVLGRAYLAIVLPFHRRIVPAMLNRAAG